MNSLVAQSFPLAGAGQSEMLHSLVAVMLWAVLQAELTVSPVPLMGGVSPEPHQQFDRTQSCWVSEAVVLVLINFWKKQGKETPLFSLTSECWCSEAVPPLPNASPSAELDPGAMGDVLLFAEAPCLWGLSQGLQRAQGLLSPCRNSAALAASAWRF